MIFLLLFSLFFYYDTIICIIAIYQLVCKVSVRVSRSLIWKPRSPLLARRQKWFWCSRSSTTMELSLCSQSQSDILVYCSCSLLLLWQTLDPSPLIVPSYQPWKHITILKMVFIIHIIHIILIILIICSIWHYNTYAYCSFISIIVDCFLVGWLESVGSRVVYELDYKKPILFVVPIQSILGKLPLVPVGDTGTILHRMCNAFRGAPCDCRQGAGDGCRMWFVN